MGNQVAVWVRIGKVKGDFMGNYESFNDAWSDLSESIGEELSTDEFRECYVVEEIEE